MSYCVYVWLPCRLLLLYWGMEPRTLPMHIRCLILSHIPIPRHTLFEFSKAGEICILSCVCFTEQGFPAPHTLPDADIYSASRQTSFVPLLSDRLKSLQLQSLELYIGLPRLLHSRLLKGFDIGKATRCSSIRRV